MGSDELDGTADAQNGFHGLLEFAWSGGAESSLHCYPRGRSIVRFLIPIMLIGWVPICLVLMATLPRRVSVVIAVIGGWLILPPTSLSISGLTSFGKPSAITFGVLLGTALVMPERLLRFRLHLLDLSMICLCAAPFISSITNGLGAYDGVSAVSSLVFIWGLPYLVGRLHFTGERSLRDLLIGMVVGCVVLIPFCLIEMELGPVLIWKIYGFGKVPHGMRFGGWRPRVFFPDGLELGLWMSACVLAAFWLWRSGTLQRLGGFRVGRVVLPVITVTTVFCRSTGALSLLLAGLATLWVSKRLNSRLAMVLLLAAPLIYVGVRVPNLWDYTGYIDFLTTNFDAARAQSLEFRLYHEDMLIDKALQQPLFGWGGWGRARVFTEQGRDISVTDGLWIIIMGNNGAFGLGSLLASFLLPGFFVAWRYGPREWTNSVAAGHAAATCILAIFMIDSLLNAFPNAVYVVLLGGLVSSLQKGREASPSGMDEMKQPPREFLHGPRPTAVASLETAETLLADRHVELARNYRRIGASAEAALAWRHALRLLEDSRAASPEDQNLARRRLDCLNDLAWFLSNRPDPDAGDRDEAVALARRATEAEPDEPAYWNTLALALHRAGDDLGALEAAERSMNLSDVSTGFDSIVLALAHARIGRKDDARRWLNAAKQWRDLNRVNRQSLNELIHEADAALAT